MRRDPRSGAGDGAGRSGQPGGVPRVVSPPPPMAPLGPGGGGRRGRARRGRAVRLHPLHRGPGAGGAGSARVAAAVPLPGTWAVAAGSRAGYRVNEVLLGQQNVAVGRTSSVTGHLAIRRTTVTAGTFTLTRGISLAPVPATGKVRAYRATVSLTLHGHTRQVLFGLKAERTTAQ